MIRRVVFSLFEFGLLWVFFVFLLILGLVEH
jgi:hypothetical protein